MPSQLLYHPLGGNTVKRKFVVPTLRSESALAILTLTVGCVSNSCLVD